MKPTRPIASERIRWQGAALIGMGMAVSPLSAADTNAPAAAAPTPLTPQEMFEGGKEAGNNWVELSLGGFITEGSQAQFQERHQSVTGPFGGISDFHYQRNLDKTTTLAADGRALFDEHDYKLSLDVTREKLGYLRFSYQEYRTWSNGDGGFYPPLNLWYALPGDALALDRGEISIEGGLRREKVPSVTFKYTHNFREGEKSSSMWGITHPDIGVTQNLSPSFRDIDEHSDAFQLDVAHRIKSTDFGAGLRYETGELDNAVKITQAPGEPVEQKVTDREGTSYDLFNVHAFVESWVRKNLLLTSAYSFSDLDNDFSGSRIYGSDFDVGYVPGLQSGFGYYGLNGGSRLKEHVVNLNLLAKVSRNFALVPSLRVQKEDADADFTGTETYRANAPAAFDGSSDRGLIDVRERLEATYTGVTNWVFSARGEWTQGDGDLTETGGYDQALVAGAGIPSINRRTDDSRFFQRYGLEARWYPTRRVSANVGGYYKKHRYEYDHAADSTANDGSTANVYPAYLVLQSFETCDGNAGVTVRPWQNVTLVGRYEYQWSTIQTRPDPASSLSETESSRMTSHILAGNVAWIPWSRLSLQAGFNYVLSETKTPVSDYAPPAFGAAPVLAAQNDYWTVNFSSGLVLDDRTDLNLNYFYYAADNYRDNSPTGVPYGAGASEHGVTAAIVRRITEHLRLTLKYGYYRYSDDLSGGNNDYKSHALYSSVQYRF